MLDDRFEIIQFIGAGSFGAVYRAKQMVFGWAMRDVAIKLFKADKVTTQNVHDVFSDAVTLIGLTETERCPPDIARQLIQVYDIGVVKRPVAQAYLTMKLVPGGKTLETAIARWRGAGGMPVETALRFLRQLLAPLAWMHTLETPAVHGDLKPDNVLMTDASDLVLTDFGLAGRLPLGTIGGAINYQAPETLLGGTGEAPADMYAVGIVWYEMITGRHPFEAVQAQGVGGDDSSAFAQAHFAARKWPVRMADPAKAPEEDLRIAPSSELNEEMREHPQLDAMLRRCLAFRQSERYPNARLLLDDIDRYLRDGVAAPPPSPPPQDVRLSPKTPEASVQDVRAMLAGGQIAQALGRAEELAQKHPRFLPALLVLASAYMANRQMEQARAMIGQAQKLDTSNPEALETLADWFDAMNRPSMAATMRAQALERRAKPGPRR
jgi:serine/threonine protein kinase